MRSVVFKRIMDVILATTALITLAPLMVLMAICIRLALGSPVFFIQKRPGLGGKPFNNYKFRTMLELVDEYGKRLPAEKRLTSFGLFLRSSSLDELPQLINVIKGDVSLVGPRPLLVRYLARYTPEQARRHEVKPGITGWAQINGRNGLSWEERFRLDVWYVDNWNLWLDIKILFKTLIAVLRRDGISSKGSGTTIMPEFFDSDNTHEEMFRQST